MKIIQLTQGKTALIDDEDFELVSQKKWRAAWNGWNWYAITGGGVRTFYMHRIIMNARTRRQIDHANGDTLDNRRENLRFASPSQNAANRSYTKRNVAKVKGVRWEQDRQRWLARIRVDGKDFNLGRYILLEDAKAAYATAAKKHFGDFAQT